MKFHHKTFLRKEHQIAKKSIQGLGNTKSEVAYTFLIGFSCVRMLFNRLLLCTYTHNTYKLCFCFPDFFSDLHGIRQMKTKICDQNDMSTLRKKKKYTHIYIYVLLCSEITKANINPEFQQRRNPKRFCSKIKYFALKTFRNKIE